MINSPLLVYFRSHLQPFPASLLPGNPRPPRGLPSRSDQSQTVICTPVAPTRRTSHRVAPTGPATINTTRTGTTPAIARVSPSNVTRSQTGDTGISRRVPRILGGWSSDRHRRGIAVVFHGRSTQQ